MSLTATSSATTDTTTATPAGADMHAAAAGGSQDLQALLAAQRAAFLRDGPPSASLRRNRIDRLVALLTENASELSEALTADFGSRPHSINLFADILGTLPDINYTRSHVSAWMKPHRVLPGAQLLGLSAVIDQKPLGVVGIIGPWNFPIALVAQPAASAFAAGNRVMIKMSEVTSRASDLFAELAAQYFSPEELVVVTGGPEVGAAFSELRFDHLFFTGSPAVGALVAKSAGANLVPVTLELGGKNPLIVARGSDLAKTAERVVASRMVNGGQVCLCPDYAFVPREQLDEFVTLAMDAARRMFPTVAENSDMVSIVNDRNFDRVVALIEDAKARGAHVIDAAPAGESLPNRATRKIAPTIVLGVTEEMGIAHDEVFGPVLTVYPYDTVDEIVSYVTSHPSPLAAYWYGPQGAGFKQFRALTTSGGVTVNDFAVHFAVNVAPFGGVGKSGSGAYHGKSGFDAFTHRRTVAKTRLPFSMAKLMLPPFTPRTVSTMASYLKSERAKNARRLKAHH